MTKKNNDCREDLETDLLRCIYKVYDGGNLAQIEGLEVGLEKILGENPVADKIMNLPFRDTDRIEARRIGYETAIIDQLYKIYGAKNKTKIKIFEDAIKRLILDFGKDVIYGVCLEERK